MKAGHRTTASFLCENLSQPNGFCETFALTKRQLSAFLFNTAALRYKIKSKHRYPSTGDDING